MLKKLTSVFLLGCMLIAGMAFAEEEANYYQPIAILYTNDVHCGIESGIGYAGLAAYKNAYDEQGYAVALVDNGDAIQGGPIGTLSEGLYITDIMNYVGYDVAALGNHEFDYGLEALDAAIEAADFPYVSANYCDQDGNLVLDPYVILDLGNFSVGFVGVATPETFIKSNPKYFKDEDGNYVLGFCQGENGTLLYSAVQDAVDAAIEEGAEIIVAMSHLGTDALSSPYTTKELISNTTGIDVVLDGHSHLVCEKKILLNADGEEVILSSTGTKFANIGALIITAEDTESGIALNMNTRLHSETLFQDADTAMYVEGVKGLYEETLNEVIGYAEADLATHDPATGKRMIRSRETNLGDLCADAYRSLLGCDIAFANGGGIRAAIPAGDITYEQLVNMLPYGNTAGMIEISGRHILDALEMGARALPEENVCFMHVSGMSYEINTAIESSVVLDSEGSFVEVAGERRVENVLVGGEPIDPDRLYTVGAHNFLLLDGGDGLTMFESGTVLAEEVMIDNQVLITYIVNELEGLVGEEYANPYGDGRIIIK